MSIHSILMGPGGAGDARVSYTSTCTSAKRHSTARRRDVRLFARIFLVALSSSRSTIYQLWDVPKTKDVQKMGRGLRGCGQAGGLHGSQRGVSGSQAWQCGPNWRVKELYAMPGSPFWLLTRYSLLAQPSAHATSKSISCHQVDVTSPSGQVAHAPMVLGAYGGLVLRERGFSSPRQVGLHSRLRCSEIALQAF